MIQGRELCAEARQFRAARKRRKDDSGLAARTVVCQRVGSCALLTGLQEVDYFAHGVSAIIRGVVSCRRTPRLSHSRSAAVGAATERRRRTSRSTDLSVGRQLMFRVVYPWRRRRPRFGRERRRRGRDANSEHRPDHRNASVFVILGRRRGVDATTTPCASRGMPKLLGDRGRREGQQAGRCRR